MTYTEKKQLPLGIRDDVKFYDDGKDGHPEKWTNGVVTECGEESFVVQWEDLPDPTEYEFCKVEIVGNQIFETNGRKPYKLKDGKVWKQFEQEMDEDK